MTKSRILFLFIFFKLIVNAYALTEYAPFPSSSIISANLPDNVVTNNYVYSDVTIQNKLNIQKAGTVKILTHFLDIINSGNASDMDGTATGIRFNQYYYDATTPASKNSGEIAVTTETDWTSTSLSQDSAMLFYTALDGTLGEKMRIKSNGYVGIGTTNPTSKLHVYSGASGATSWSDELLTIENDTISGIQILTPANQLADIIFADPDNQSQAGFQYDHANDILKFLTGGWSIKMSIDNDGKVGIGDTAPSNLLSIKSSSGGLQYPLKIQNPSGDNSGSAYVGALFAVEENSYGKGAIVFQRTGTWAKGKLHFLLNNTEDGNNPAASDVKMTIDNNGNVGIGTSNPSYLLQLGTTEVSSGESTRLALSPRYYTTGTWLFNVQSEGLGVERLKISYGSNNILTLRHDNKVGIGTTEPSVSLEIAKAGTVKANTEMLRLTNSGNASDMDNTQTSIDWYQYYYDVSTPAPFIAGRIFVGTEQDATSTSTTQDTSMMFATTIDGSLTEKMRINSAGNVGIGTNNPVYKLQVNGSFYQQGTGVINFVDSDTKFASSAGYGTILYQNGNVQVATNLYVPNGVTGIKTSSPGSTLSIAGNVSIGSTYAGNTATTSGLIVEGNVGIGVASPTYKLQFNGNFYQQGGGLTNFVDSDTKFASSNGYGTVLYQNGDVDVAGRLNVKGGHANKITSINASTYSLTSTDFILHVTYTSTGTVTITLPTAQVGSGRTIVIKDAGGNAGTNNITIATEGTETIDGSATAVINTNYSAINLYCDGANWFIF